MYRAYAPGFTAAGAGEDAGRRLPGSASLTILVGAYPLAAARSVADIRSMTEWLEASGFRVYYAETDSATGQRWQRVLAGAYTDERSARADADRLKQAVPSVDARVVAAAAAGRAVGTSPATPEIRRAGIEP